MSKNSGNEECFKYFNSTSNRTEEDCFEFDSYPDLTQISVVCTSFIVIYLVIMVLSIFGNAAVCYTVMSNRKMHTVVNYYIVNLAVCDFMVGAFVLPVKLLELTAPAEWSILSDNLCAAMLYLQTVFVFASVLTLVATCIERYFAIVHPLESRIQQSKSRTIKILITVWLIPILGAGPFLWPMKARDNVLTSDWGTISRVTCAPTFSEQFRVRYYSFLFIFFYLIPLTFIAWTCLRITQCLLKSTTLCRESSLRRQEVNRRKVAKMVIIVVVAFAISWTPYFLVSIITQYQEENYLTKHNFFFSMLIINFFAFLNSSTNPFIYVAMSTRFRHGFWRLFRGLLCAFHDPEEGAGEPANDLMSRPRHRFATFAKYHRQMVLFACGEPTQISTDSLPTDMANPAGIGRQLSSPTRRPVRTGSSPRLPAQTTTNTNGGNLHQNNNLIGGNKKVKSCHSLAGFSCCTEQSADASLFDGSEPAASLSRARSEILLTLEAKLRKYHQNNSNNTGTGQSHSTYSTSNSKRSCKSCHQINGIQTIVNCRAGADFDENAMTIKEEESIAMKEVSQKRSEKVASLTAYKDKFPFIDSQL